MRSLGAGVRRCWVVGAAGVLAVVFVAAPLAWMSAAATARANVQVLLDDRRFDCADPRQVTDFAHSLGDADGAVLQVPALLLTPDLACEFSFVVRNAGDAEVAINSVRLPFLGRSNGLGLHAELRELGRLSQDHEQDIDALFDDETSRDPLARAIVVPAGDAIRFTVAVTWADGCLADGTTQIVDDAPVLGITALGLPGTISPAGPVYAGTGTADSFAAGC